MTLGKHDLPLFICHAFPYESCATYDDKKTAVTKHLSGICERGFGGVVTNVSFVNNYTLDEEEWRVFSFVADECERLGLRLWIYDEHGYPSGTAGGLTMAEDPDFEAVGIVMVKKVLAAGESVTLELP